MSINHIFNRISDNVARRQAIQHAAMTHRDTIIDRNGVKFFRNTTRFFNLSRN